ncbi:MAG TPA: sigma 54-interacting transcriptional regulator [Pirellulales bacterium]|nr:sigma 54-interacting transcriptional regulator [Pirellulales bacterium]
MALRTVAADLVRLLDAAAGPVYVLDDQRRILFVNDACAAWAGCAAGELVGQESRYHSSGEVTGPAAIAAALAPPPEVWTGQRARAVVSLAGASGNVVARHVDFVPLGTDVLDMAGVIGFGSPHEANQGTLEGSLATDESPRALHERLAHWRRKLAGQYHIDRLLGENAAIRQVRKQVELAAASTASVSIVGPPGSGRQHAARAIHYGRAAQTAGPLVPLACPLLSANLLETTLRALARSGAAVTGRPGTLWLCDVEDLDDEVQQQLVRELAGKRTFRMIATSREPLTALAAAGKFRADLACALATIEIRLPPLAGRIEDLPLLAQLFVEEQNRQGTKQLAGLSPEALDRLAIYPWPGNIEELAEVIAAAHQSAEGPRIVPADLPAKIQYSLDAAARPRRVEETIVLEDFLARIEEELIRRAMAQAKGNKTKAARLLGMTRPRLYRRLVQLGLEEAEEET